MRKVIVACPCGQRMQVSRSAYGKIGVCPKCNQKIRVGANGAEPLALPSPDTDESAVGARPPFEFAQRAESRPEDTKRRFARAVDHFYHGRYGEALTILEELHRELPFNEQIKVARAKCLDALNAPKTEPVEQAAQHEPTPAAATPAAATPAATDEEHVALTAEAVQQTVARLMTSGSTEEVRLKAAELAIRLLGLDHPPEHVEAPGLFFANFASKTGNGKVWTHAAEGAAGALKP